MYSQVSLRKKEGGNPRKLGKKLVERLERGEADVQFKKNGNAGADND